MYDAMKKTIVYIHGKNGKASEADQFKPLYPDYNVVGFDYKSAAPWEAEEEFPAFFDSFFGKSEGITLIANSIGTYYSMCSLSKKEIDKAFFISPVVDMEVLICKMMAWSGIPEEELREKREIPTRFGETISWEYLSFVRAHPIRWDVPTEILYGENDNLISRNEIETFAEHYGANLTVYENGEHWFHTPEQTAFLNSWLSCLLGR